MAQVKRRAIASSQARHADDEQSFHQSLPEGVLSVVCSHMDSRTLQTFARSSSLSRSLAYSAWVPRALSIDMPCTAAEAHAAAHATFGGAVSTWKQHGGVHLTIKPNSTRVCYPDNPDRALQKFLYAILANPAGLHGVVSSLRLEGVGLGDPANLQLTHWCFPNIPEAEVHAQSTQPPPTCTCAQPHASAPLPPAAGPSTAASAAAGTATAAPPATAQLLTAEEEEAAAAVPSTSQAHPGTRGGPPAPAAPRPLRQPVGCLSRLDIHHCRTNRMEPELLCCLPSLTHLSFRCPQGEVGTRMQWDINDQIGRKTQPIGDLQGLTMLEVQANKLHWVEASTWDSLTALTGLKQLHVSLGRDNIWPNNFIFPPWQTQLLQQVSQLTAVTALSLQHGRLHLPVPPPVLPQLVRCGQRLVQLQLGRVECSHVKTLLQGLPSLKHLIVKSLTLSTSLASEPHSLESLTVRIWQSGSGALGCNLGWLPSLAQLQQPLRLGMFGASVSSKVQPHIATALRADVDVLLAHYAQHRAALQAAGSGGRFGLHRSQAPAAATQAAAAAAVGSSGAGTSSTAASPGSTSGLHTASAHTGEPWPVTPSSIAGDGTEVHAGRITLSLYSCDPGSSDKRERLSEPRLSLVSKLLPYCCCVRLLAGQELYDPCEIEGRPPRPAISSERLQQLARALSSHPVRSLHMNAGSWAVLADAQASAATGSGAAGKQGGEGDATAAVSATTSRAAGHRAGKQQQHHQHQQLLFPGLESMGVLDAMYELSESHCTALARLCDQQPFIGQVTICYEPYQDGACVYQKVRKALAGVRGGAGVGAGASAPNNRLAAAAGTAATARAAPPSSIAPAPSSGQPTFNTRHPAPPPSAAAPPPPGASTAAALTHAARPSATPPHISVCLQEAVVRGEEARDIFDRFPGDWDEDDQAMKEAEDEGLFVDDMVYEDPYDYDSGGDDYGDYFGCA